MHASILPSFIRRLSNARLPALATTLAFFTVATLPAQPTPSATPEIGRPTVSVGHTRSILDSIVSPDGKKLFTMDGENLRAWDIESARELKLLNSGGSRPAFSEKRKWLLIPGGVTIFNYETLAYVTTVRSHNPQCVFWDDERDVGIVIGVREGGRNNQILVRELVPKGDKIELVPRAVVTITAPNDKGGRSLSVMPLDANRLLVDTTLGYFVIDRTTWKASRPDIQPIANDDRVTIFGEEDLPKTTFPLLPSDRRLGPGPENTVLACTHDSAKSDTLVEVLSAKDLSVLRSARVPESNLFLTRAYNFDSKARTLWLRTYDKLLALDFDSLALRESHPFDPQGRKLGAGIYGAHRLKESHQWILNSDETPWRYDADNKTIVETFGDRVATVWRIVTSPKGFEFIVTSGKKAKRVRILPNGLDISSVDTAIYSMAYSADGEIIARGLRSEGRVEITERNSWPKVDYRMPQREAFKHASGENIAFSDDGTTLIMQGARGVGVVDVTNGKVLLDEPLSGTWLAGYPYQAAISPDKRWAVALDGKEMLVGFDLTAPEGKRRVWEHPTSHGGHFRFISKTTFLISTHGGVEYHDITTGQPLAAQPDSKATSGVASAISQDNKLAAFHDYEGLKLFDIETGKKLWRIETATNVSGAAFFANSRYLITISTDNLIRIWDTQEKRELCTLAFFEYNNEWVVSSSDLRFDASEKAIDKMYVVKGTEVIPLEALFEKLYTPKLLASLLRGEKLEAPIVDIKKLQMPPTIRLESADGTRNLIVEDDTNDNARAQDSLRLRALADARQSTVAEIRLFQNGKLLTTAQGRGAQFVENFEVKLVPGENVFRAVALNADRTESRPVEVIFTYRPKATAASVAGSTAQQPAGLQLHLLIVGVNTYKNPKYNLNYAVADATAVKEKIEAQTKSIFSAVNVKFILNDQAQKSAITDAFRELSAKAGARDVFVFYYAGHGVMTADAKPEFFLVPHDVLQLYGADDALRQNGLSSAELLELSRLMPAQKQLFILDACQSAGALTTVAMRGAAEEKAIAQLARSSGTHWLTASGSEQFATEFAQLGHGAFTYALLEGLGGRADTGDGRITVNELKAFLESEVPEITQKHKGTPQFPSSYGFGQDFPVVIKTQ